MLGIRKDFNVHKRKTVESFGLVRADISSINANIEQIRNSLASVEARIITLGTDIGGLRNSIDRCSSDINAHETAHSDMNSKIESIDESIGGINESISTAVAKIASFKSRVDSIASRNGTLLRGLSGNSQAIKRVLPRLNKQSLKTRKIGSDLRKARGEIEKSKRRHAKARKLAPVVRESQDQITKVKNLINRKLRTIKKRDTELELTIKRQRRRILELNRKIEGKKIARRAAGKIIRKTAPKKRVVKKILPRKTIKKTITPKKTVTETTTPKKKEIVEVIKGKQLI